MSGDENDDEAEAAEGEDAHDPPRWAADEPTAMWDDSLLKDSGYEQLADHRAQAPRDETGPATSREVGGDLQAGVHVSRELTGAHPHERPAAAKRGSSVSWILTLSLAVILGVGVYALIRLLR